MHQQSSTPESTYRRKRVKVAHTPAEPPSSIPTKEDVNGDEQLASKKFKAWSAHATSSSFPTFGHPTPQECKDAYDVLDELHGAAVEEEFKDPETPESIPYVLDAVVMALLSQATS